MTYTITNSRIVVIDDEEFWANKIISILNEQKFHFVESKYPLPPFSELSDRYDLAIVDIRMKRFDGFQIKDFFKTKSPTTKVLLMSVHDDYDINILDKAKGADGWFHKQDLERDELSFIMKVSSLLSEREEDTGFRKNNQLDKRKESNMGGKIDIHTTGDVVIGNGNSNVSFEKHNINSTPNQLEIINLLKELGVSIGKIVSDLQPDAAEDLKKDFNVFSEELNRKKPRKEWFDVSAKGLMDAAKSIGAIGKPIIEIVQSILKLISF
jgi:DNA-binding response OmpR family regulator